MAGSRCLGASQVLKRIAVAVAVIASALAVLPIATQRAAAETTVDQQTPAQCTTENYPAERNGGVYRQTFTPALNRLTVVQLCTTTTDPGLVELAVQTAGGTTISTGSVTPSTGGIEAWLEVNVADVILTPGVEYQLVATLPGGVAWRGTDLGVDAYPGGGAADEGVGDYGFRTFADPVTELHTTRGGFEAATTDVRLVEETFDTRPDGEPIFDQIPGVTLTTTSGYDLQVFIGSGGPRLFAIRNTNPTEVTYNYRAVFDEPTAAVGFDIAALDPNAPNGVTVTLQFTDDTSTSFQLLDDDGNESTPFWFGYRHPSKRIASVDVVGPFGATETEFAEEFSLDDFTFERDLPDAIAFSRGFIEGGNEIYVMDADGANEKAITNNGAGDFDPHWSPDGDQIAFVSDRAGQFDIWVMDSDGTDPRNLTASVEEFSADPTWGPGNKIAFVKDNPAGFLTVLDVFIVNPDGSGLQVVQDDSASYVRDAFPSFDATGQALFFGRGNENTPDHHVFKKGLPGTDLPLTQITADAGNQVHPAGSPTDADKLAYVQESWNGTADAEVYVLDGDVRTRITENAFRDELPAWSPDSSSLVFGRTLDGEGVIVRYDFSTASETVLTSGAFDSAPSWNPTADEEVSTATLVADRETAKVGTEGVDLADIPAEFLALIASGAQAAKLEAAPAGSIPAGSIPAGSIPAGSIPAGSIPAGSIPAGSIDVRQSPAGSIPVYSLFIADLPAGSIPAGSIPAGSIPAGSIGLHGTLLSSLGLSAEQLEALLVGTALEGLPRQTLTLKHVLDDPTAAPRFAQLDLAQSGLAKTFFASVGLGPLLLGAHPMNLIPVPAGASPTPTDDWCSVLVQTTGVTCAEFGIDPNVHSFLGAQLTGAPIGSLPAGSIPAGSIPAGSIALWSLPAGSIAVEGTPAGSIPAGSIAVEGTPAGSIPAGSILVKDSPAGSIPASSIPAGSISAGSIFAKGTPAGSIPAGSIATESSQIGQIALTTVANPNSPVGSIPAGSIPAGSIDQVLTCGGASSPSCPPGLTLADANILGYLRSTAKLWMLGPDALAGVTVGDVIAGLPADLTLLDLTREELDAILLWMIAPLLEQYGVTLADLAEVGLLDGIVLGDLPPSAFADISLYEIILQLLIRSDFPWENLPLDGTQEISPVPDNEVGYTARAEVLCAAGDTATFDLDLGEFRYLGGTGAIAIDGGDAVGAQPVAIPGGELRWTIPGVCDGAAHDVVVTFEALPGLRLGLNTADLTVTAGADVQRIEDQAGVQVTENGEPDATGRSETKDRLIIGHLSSETDVDTITVPMPEKGSRVRVFLSHVPEGADYDLAIAQPPAPGGPLQSTPAGSIPAGSIPLEDDGRSLDGSTALQNETLQDVPAGSIPAGSISANRGSEDEIAQVIANGGSGPITIRVTGYLGSHSPEPYLVRVRVFDPIVLECDPHEGITPPTAPFPSLPAPTPGIQSLFIVNTDRMYDLYDDAEVATMLSKLSTFVARPEVNGAILPVEADADVREAYANWDADPCSIDAANAVVREINDVITPYRAASAALKDVVLLGTDLATPFARNVDLVTLSNEQDEVVDLAFTLGEDGKANALYAAAAHGYFLTNDAYTSFTHVPWLDRQLLLAQIGVSRLVETPGDISGQLDEYVREDGIIDTDTATTFVTGYDFIADGSEDIAENTELAIGQDPARIQRLISESWAKTDLTNVLLDGSTPTINSLNAHFSHNLLQPAGPTSGGGGAGFTRTDLFSAGEIPAPTVDGDGNFTSTLIGRLLFSMGCHGGLNVDDRLAPNAPEAFDWAQTAARQRAAVWIGATGYAYGDTVENALSERLLTIFSRHLSDPSTTLSEKLVLAKHEYFSTMGTYGVFDEKVLLEMAYYGVPFWRVGPAGPPPAGPTPPVVTDGKASLSIDPVAEGVTQHQDERGTYWATGEDREVAFAPYRPFQPLITKPVTVPGQTATGVLLRGLSTTDIEVEDFARALPTIDLSANEPEPAASNDIYPANLVRLATTKPYGRLDQKLVVVAGQSRANETGEGGVERLLSSLDVDVLYGGSTTPPDVVIDSVSSVFTPTGPGTNGVVAFQATAGGPGSLDEAYGLYKVDGSDEWVLVEMLEDSEGVWRAEVAVPNEKVQLLFQGVKSGHVFYSTNKGFFFEALIQDSTAPTIQVTTPAAGQVFTPGQHVVADYECLDPNLLVCEGDVPDGAVLDTTTPGPRVLTVEAVDRAGNRHEVEVPFSVEGEVGDTTGPSISIMSPAAITYARGATVVADYSCTDPSGVSSCDGPVADGAAIDTSTLGPKEFTVTAEDGAGNVSSRTVAYTVVDKTAPGITITTPANGARYILNQPVNASYACTDEAGGSGVASCAGPVPNGQPIDTSSVGTKSFKVIATDHNGNTFQRTVSYDVVYTFSGFYSPVNNPPVFNKMTAGAAVPIKFRLTDYYGVQTTTTSAVVSTTSQQISCDSGDAQDVVEQTLTAGSSSLRYDTTAEQFVYTWKTEVGWVNTCRAFVIKFNDGRSYRANFSFRK